MEILCRGRPVLPTLQLHHLIDRWFRTAATCRRVTASVGTSAKDFVMVLTYCRKVQRPWNWCPPQFSLPCRSYMHANRTFIGLHCQCCALFISDPFMNLCLIIKFLTFFFLVYNSHCIFFRASWGSTTALLCVCVYIYIYFHHPFFPSGLFII